MFSLGKTIISSAVFEEKFACDLQKCRGQCCLYGDSGAPLENEEAEILENFFPVLRNYMRPEGIKAVEKKGTSMLDKDGDLVTPLIGNAECAYTLYNNGIYYCAIEKAWEDKKISFRKPISCHLFPLRIKKYEEFDAVNYEELKICKPAVRKGVAENIPVYRFLEEALVRAYGKKWYNELLIAAEEIKKNKSG
ncbi:MAG TPA: DUF3109 domain-containing protein [Bacteroidales bacterium]|nr:DUF3109 domain-containing protein [Bacteroidales bacterium]